MLSHAVSITRRDGHQAGGQHPLHSSSPRPPCDRVAAAARWLFPMCCDAVFLAPSGLWATRILAPPATAIMRTISTTTTTATGKDTATDTLPGGGC